MVSETESKAEGSPEREAWAKMRGKSVIWAPPAPVLRLRVKVAFVRGRAEGEADTPEQPGTERRSSRGLRAGAAGDCAPEHPGTERRSIRGLSGIPATGLAVAAAGTGQRRGGPRSDASAAASRMLYADEMHP
jgi:hypothetical protein